MTDADPVIDTIASALEDQAIIPSIVPEAVQEFAYRAWATEVFAALAVDGHLKDIPSA